MGSVNVKETRRFLKSLLDRAEGGETITIARRGEVVARLVPPLPASTPTPIAEPVAPVD